LAIVPEPERASVHSIACCQFWARDNTNVVVQEEREMRNTIMQVQSSKPSGNRNRVSGFLRLFIFSLLTTAFACTTLNAQTVAYVVNQSFALSSGTVSVINTSTNAVIATIPVGTQPAGR
jgi:YVTN family beta-propeller protein